jgi:hypothetical protein
LHKPLRYPVRYGKVQRVDFVGGQTSRKDPSIAVRMPYTAPGNQSPTHHWRFSKDPTFVQQPCVTNAEEEAM